MTGLLAIGLAVAFSVPAAPAPDPQASDQGKAAGTASKAVSVAVPIGKVSVGPKLVDGEQVFVRRTTGSGGMAIVEVSTTPFTPVLSATDRPVAVAVPRPDQPASW